MSPIFTLLAASVLGGLALIWLLVLLQKKLRIFTKGTIAFMVTALIVVTAVSFIELGSDIRIRESRARRVARQFVPTNFLRAWLEGDQSSVRSLSNQSLLENIEDIQDDLEDDLGISLGEDDEDSSLVAFDVFGRRRYVHSEDEWHFPFWALLQGCGNKFVTLEGTIMTDEDQQIVGVDAKMSRPSMRDARSYYSRSTTYKNPNFKKTLSHNSRHNSRRRFR